MKGLLLLCAVCINLGGSYGSDDTDGVGVFAYQDSTGNRYGGTYGLKDGQVVDTKGNFPPNFSPPTFPDFDDFFPEYFSNLENLLQEANPFYPPPIIRPPPFIRRPYFNPNIFRTFDSSVDQNLAYDAARKAFDLTSNQAGYIPNFTPSRFQIPYGNNFGRFGGFGNMAGPGFPGFPGFQIPDYGPNGNSAFASAAVGPGFRRQMAVINPANPNNPNVQKSERIVPSGPGNFNSVSSSSQVNSFVGPDGKKTETRRAETTVNNNGDVTTYKVQS